MEYHDDDLHEEESAAAFIKSNKRTMQRWRQTGDGPVFVKIGRAVRYRHADLIDFIHRGRRAHTGATVAPNQEPEYATTTASRRRRRASANGTPFGPTTTTSRSTSAP